MINKMQHIENQIQTKLIDLIRQYYKNIKPYNVHIFHLIRQRNYGFELLDIYKKTTPIYEQLESIFLVSVMWKCINSTSNMLEMTQDSFDEAGILPEQHIKTFFNYITYLSKKSSFVTNMEKDTEKYLLKITTKLLDTLNQIINIQLEDITKLEKISFQFLN
jgi:hypothetical protein